MSYTSIAQMASDAYLRDRITACAATEPETKNDPVQWTMNHAWQVVAAPGWDLAWDSAIAGEVPDPGKDPGVISDSMILSRVQELIAEEAEPPGQE